MPLTLKAHQIANQFRQEQSSLQKAKQVYLNMLAVQTVESYLGWLGIETDLQASDSWNPVMRVLADTADLVVKGRGKLECRPVMPGEDCCHVPPEVWSDRIGYVPVQFDQALREATLLGFVPLVTAPELPLSQLRSLDELVDQLTSVAPTEPAKMPVLLGQWLQGNINASWQTVEELFGIQQPTWSFRSMSPSQVVESPMTRGKLLNLETELQKVPVALLVRLEPSHRAVDIWVKVCPTGNQTYLPEALEVMVLDEVGVAVMQAQSRKTEMIQLKFSGVPGEKFSINLVLGTQSITEVFVI